MAVGLSGRLDCPAQRRTELPRASATLCRQKEGAAADAMRGHKNTFEPRWRCAWCNEPFAAKPSSGQRYCSLECYRKDTFGRKTWKVDFRPNAASERDAVSAQRVMPRRVFPRVFRDGEKRYVAYSADEVIEIDSLAHHGRPGMPY